MPRTEIPANLVTEDTSTLKRVTRWQKYRNKHAGVAVRAIQTRISRRVSTPDGIRIARPYDWIVEVRDSEFRVWWPGDNFEGAHERIG